MSVMVYSRLGDVLRTRNLTVSDLQRQIAARFDFAVDARRDWPASFDLAARLGDDSAGH